MDLKKLLPANRLVAITTILTALAGFIAGLAGVFTESWQNTALVAVSLLTKLVTAIKFMDGSQKFDALKSKAAVANPMYTLNIPPPAPLGAYPTTTSAKVGGDSAGISDVLHSTLKSLVTEEVDAQHPHVLTDAKLVSASIDPATLAKMQGVQAETHVDTGNEPLYTAAEAANLTPDLSDSASQTPAVEPAPVAQIVPGAVG